MKSFFLFLIFASSSFLFAKEPGKDENPTGEVVLSERLNRVASHLGEGGAHFSVTDVDGDLTSFAEFLDRIIKEIPLEDQIASPVELGNFSFSDLVKTLGLDNLEGLGRSASEKEDFWHNRSFLMTNGRPEGVLSLLGSASEDWVAPQFAPAETDLLLETEMDLRALQTIAEKMAKSFGKEGQEQLEEAMKEKISSTGVTLGDFLSQFSVRVSFVAWLDRELKIPVEEGIEVPMPHFVLRLDQADLIMNVWKEDLTANLEVIEEDGETTYLGPQIDGPAGPLQPRLIHVKATDELWFAPNEEDLEVARGKGTRLKDDAGFRDTWAGLQEKGNVGFYLSRSCLDELIDLAQTGIAKVKESGDEEAVAGASLSMDWLNRLKGKYGYALALSVEKNGILSAMNVPFPDKGGHFTNPTSIALVAAMASLATPVILKARESAELTTQTSNLRQIGIVLFMYDQEFGQFPDDLNELHKKGHMDKESFDELGVMDFGYVPGLSTSDHGNTIVMYTKEDYDGKRAYLRLDNSVQQKRITLEELKKKISLQK